MSDPYLDALEQLDQMRDRAFKAEAARDRLANQLLNEVPDSYIQMKARALDAEAAIQRVRELHRTVVDEVFTDFGWDGEVEHCQECGYVPTDDEPCPTLAALEYRHVESSNPRTLTETPDRHESPSAWATR